MTPPIIFTKGLTVFYGKNRGILDVDLKVRRGEVFGFLGPNGAGKTTTLRVFMDLIRPLRGSAHIFGLDCQQEGIKIRQRIGYLPGDLTLYQNLTGSEYLDLVSRVRGVGGDSRYRQDLCKQLELDPDRRIGEYSRGNRQKVGVVAAFMNKADLLILDEPTTGLDPLIQRRVLDIVRNTRAEGRTVFFSSHVLTEVQAVADKVGIIREGRLVAIERVNELTERNFRRIRLWFEQAPTVQDFEIEGISLLEQHGTSLTFEVRTGMDRLLQAAAEHNVRDIETLPVNLEDVFLAYYGKETSKP